MTKPQALLAALPFHQLSRRADLILAASVTLVVAMVIVPLPAPILDFFLAVNLACSLGILLSALFAKRALELSTFPTLLLVTTLFRLALNISTIRGILAQGHAGEVVKAFGRLLLQGDIVVGAVLFLVITLVQFLVIAKGAERVAEVGARFTLDAMPGKQMSIDAAVRSGAIDETEGERRRRELSRESQLFGNMDGAMKFVKGDAVAGLVITAINLIAGLLIGVTRRGMSIGDALDTYSVLSVGDGLVSQIPALLITLAAGLIFTPVEAAEVGADLGASVRAELLRNFIVVLPEMVNQVQAWIAAPDASPRVKRLHGFMLTYLYHPTDYIPEDTNTLFGYLDDAYMFGSLYIRLLSDVRPTRHLSNLESISRQLPLWLRVTRSVLPKETREMDRMLDELERDKTDLFYGVMGWKDALRAV